MVFSALFVRCGTMLALTAVGICFRYQFLGQLALAGGNPCQAPIRQYTDDYAQCTDNLAPRSTARYVALKT